MCPGGELVLYQTEGAILCTATQKYVPLCPVGLTHRKMYIGSQPNLHCIIVLQSTFFCCILLQSILQSILLQMISFSPEGSWEPWEAAGSGYHGIPEQHFSPGPPATRGRHSSHGFHGQPWNSEMHLQALSMQVFVKVEY